MIAFLILLVLITGYMVCAEIVFERDWPRRTIKGLIISLALLFMGLQAFGQISRYDQIVSTINSSAPIPGGLYPALYIPGASIAICNAPANAVPCTNYAATYTDASGGTACPISPKVQQLTRPGSNICVANADAEGGFGVWIGSGNHQYTITTTYGSFGPYDFSTSTGGGLNGGTVLVTTQNQPTFTFSNPASLQSVITSAGANSDIQLGCGTYNTGSLLLSNANVHLHGSNNSTGNCVNVNFTGAPRYGMHFTANNIEVDHISFSGNTEECNFRDATTHVYIHDNSYSGCGATPSTGGATGVFMDIGGTDNLTENNISVGNGTPMPGGGGGACFNYQINNILTPSWRGGTWGSVPCPQSAGYTALVQNEIRPHYHNNQFRGNNFYIGVTYFDDRDIDSLDNYIDQGNAYQNDNNTDALVGQGYGELCYTTLAQELEVGTLSRTSNIVTWTGPNGTVIPFQVGDNVTVQFQFGTGGSDFNDGSPFTVLSVANSGGTSPTVTWYQPGPNDSTTTAANVGRSPSGHFIGDTLVNTAGSGFYTANCSRAQLIGITTSHNGQMYPTTSLGVGGISLNACDNCIVTAPNIDTVINTNQLPIGGQQYLPSGIVNAGSYNLQIINPMIKNVTELGIQCATCPNTTIQGGTLDGFGVGVAGIGYAPNNRISGLKVKGITIKGFTLTDINFPAAATGWGINNSVENSNLFGNTAAAPTSDCAVFQTSSPVRFVNNTCDGANLGTTGTMSFGVVNSSPNSLFTNNHFQNMTLAATVPFDDSSGSSVFKDNVLLNNTAGPLITAGVGTIPSYALESFMSGASAGKPGMLTPFTLNGNCNGVVQMQIGQVSGGLYNTVGCILSTGGEYSAYNAAQTGSGNWKATAAGQPTSILLQDNTGLYYYSQPAGACPLTGTNSFTTCFGASPKFTCNITSGCSASGVTSINSTAGAFTFSGPGVSCTTTTCTFSGTGTGIGSITWAIPSWLTASPTTISASGTQTISPTTGQTAHQVIGTCGSATSFAPCALVPGDVPTQRGVNAVVDWGLDNTGGSDVGATINTKCAAYSTSNTQPEVYFPAGTYLVTTPIACTGSSTTVNNLSFIGEGRAARNGAGTVTFNCNTANSTCMWFDNSTASTGNDKGPRLEHLTLIDTSSSKNDFALLRITQYNSIYVNDVSTQASVGTQYATGTVSISNGSTALTGAGTTFPAGIQFGHLQIGGNFQEVASQSSGTAATLTSNWQYTTAAGSAYAINYGGIGFLLEGTSSTGFTQYGTVVNYSGTGDRVCLDFGGGPTSSSGTSRIHFYGGYCNGARVADSIGVFAGKFSDTHKIDFAVNNVARGFISESAHALVFEGELENTGTFTVVTTCNSGVAAQSCTKGVVLNADATTTGHDTRILGGYIYTWGTGISVDSANVTTGQIDSVAMRGNTTTNYAWSDASTGCSTTQTNAAVFQPDCATSQSAMSAPSATFTGSGIPIATGSASNTDLAGSVTLSGGTGTYTFSATYVTTPICTATDTTTAAAVKTSASTTVLTITGTGTDVVNYICIGRT